MRLGTTRWLLVGVLCLVLSPAVVCAQVTRWEESMAAASQALQEGRYAAAEKLLLVALQEAQKFGEQDPRLGISHLALGRVYQEQSNQDGVLRQSRVVLGLVPADNQARV